MNNIQTKDQLTNIDVANVNDGSFTTTLSPSVQSPV